MVPCVRACGCEMLVVEDGLSRREALGGRAGLSFRMRPRPGRPRRRTRDTPSACLVPSARNTHTHIRRFHSARAAQKHALTTELSAGDGKP
eukprot:4675635-Prymnesium_polylepis.2